MKQIILMAIAFLTILSYQIAKVFLASLGVTSFMLPITITLTIIVVCGLIHYFDAKEESTK